jgi:uncharacterized membrane protein YedE/YeeE
MSWVDTPYLLATGLLTGLVFGVLLQKGGVTRYGTILGQFLFTDYTVLKVMLTAIVVGAIGVYGMLQFGLISHLLMKPALLAANIAGGLIFGVGMATLGYCPGTGVGACGEGSRRAMWGVAGMVAGAAAFTAAFPRLEQTFMKIGDRGKVTLADISGLSPWVFIAALAVIALVLFRAIGRWERRQAA